MDFDIIKKNPDITLTYLEDWFSKKTSGLFFKEIPLNSAAPYNRESEKFYCLSCMHEGDRLTCSLRYGRSYLLEENAEKYISMLERCMKNLLRGG